jgi:hypothetical protein
MADLIDAGIPLRLKMSSFCEPGGSSSFFVRTLSYDLISSSYSFADTIKTPALKDSVFTSRRYGNAVMALRDFCRWKVCVPGAAKTVKIEAEMLPGYASRLNRTVDMSNICSFRKATRTVMVGEMMNDEG